MPSRMTNLIHVERPILRYHGGKWELAEWVIAHFPPHRVYVEPFGGAASVLLQKSRSYGEIYNDIDGEIVNLFRVVRERPAELLNSVEATPFARDEYRLAFDASVDPLESARRVLVRSHMGFAGAATHGHMTGFRSRSVNSGTHPGMQWREFPQHLAAIVDRLRGVVIENRDALEIIKQHDDRRTLHYIDPPYLPETRDRGRDYRFEMTIDDHRKLAELIHSLKGMVVLSGYPSRLYDQELYPTWQRITREALAEGARKRVECLWLSPATKAKLHPTLF